MELLVVTSSPQSQVHGLYLLLSHSPYLGLGPFFNLSLYLLDGSCRIITYTEAQTSLCLSLVFCHFIPASSYIHSQSQTPSHADHILSLAHIPHPHIKRTHTHTHPEQIRFPVLVLKRVVLHLGGIQKRQRRAVWHFNNAKMLWAFTSFKSKRDTISPIFRLIAAASEVIGLGQRVSIMKTADICQNVSELSLFCLLPA